MKSNGFMVQSGASVANTESLVRIDGDFTSLSVGYTMTPIDAYCIRNEEDRKADDMLSLGKAHASGSSN